MPKSSEDQITSCVGIIMLLVVAIIVATIMNGWALSVLWKWFIAPIFGLPVLNIIQAVGVAMTVNLLIVRPDSNEKAKTWTDIASAYIGKAILYPIITVLIGWLISGLL